MTKDRWLTEGQVKQHNARIAGVRVSAEVSQISATKRMQALGRLKQGVMNKTESRYADLLEQRKFAKEIAWYKFEGLKFRLADSTFYTPDFAVMLWSGEMELHECKGYWLDDAKAKIKIAADMYPFRFIAVKVKAKKDGGGWSVEEF